MGELALPLSPPWLCMIDAMCDTHLYAKPEGESGNDGRSYEHLVSNG
jgi:hypothetical protein